MEQGFLTKHKTAAMVVKKLLEEIISWYGFPMLLSQIIDLHSSLS